MPKRSYCHTNQPQWAQIINSGDARLVRTSVESSRFSKGVQWLSDRIDNLALRGKGSVGAFAGLVLLCFVLACGSKASSPHLAKNAPHSRQAKFETEIRAAPGSGKLELHGAQNKGRTLNCHVCHMGSDARRSLSKRIEQSRDSEDFIHKDVELQHGDLSCASCHDQNAGAQLHLADGTPVSTQDTMKLCAQCHGPQYRDYQQGAHGGMQGHWDLSRGPRQRNHCRHCHGAHRPAFPLVRPVAPPRDRFLHSQEKEH